MCPITYQNSIIRKTEQSLITYLVYKATYSDVLGINTKLNDQALSLDF